MAVSYLSNTTVREEVGLMGAKAFLNNNTKLHSVVNVDVCVVNKLGEGAIISMKDVGYLADRGMVEKFKSYGLKNIEIGKGGTSDHAIAQTYAPTLGVSIPSDYIHSSVSKVNLADMKEIVEASVKYIKEVN